MLTQLLRNITASHSDLRMIRVFIFDNLQSGGNAENLKECVTYKP